MFESLGLDPQIDFATVETLGNTGSAALPITLALGAEQGRLRANDHVALLGIGSGINCLMLAVEWQKKEVRIANQEIPRQSVFSRGSGREW